jgi:tellurite resistance protein TerC
MGTLPLWVGFNVVVALLIAIDLGVVQRRGGVLTARGAAAWTAVWVSLSMAFCAGLWVYRGSAVALPFFTGYIVEYALSVDNLFVFLMVFGYFKVQPAHQHHLLYWGIIGALVMRATLIVAGTVLVARFHWLLYGFGAFLIFTAGKMMFSKESDEVDPEQNPVLKFARRVLPVSKGPTGKNFFVREDGFFRVTPLLLVLIVVETTDLVFALDSIPAVLGISQDPFIVYSSNVCAILGLRSLFFVVASLMDKFHYLKVGLSVVLGFVGLKMIGETLLAPPEEWKRWLIVGSLAFIALVLAVSILSSMLWPPKLDEKVDQAQKQAGLD